MHLHLNEKAEAKALKAAAELDRSVTDVTNFLWESLETIEIVEIVRMTFKITDAEGQIRKRITKKIRKIRVNF